MAKQREEIYGKYVYAYSSASGPANDECAYLGHRYDEEAGLRPDEAEAWVLHHTPKSSAIHYGMVNWLTMLWRSPTGRVYVSDVFGTVHTNPDLTSARTDELWQKTELGGTLAGIWGLDDRCVFAWGMRDRKGQMFRWDGTSWSSIACPGQVVRIHGISANFVFAVGVDGLVSRWDGSTWQRAQVPTRETLSGVYVISDQEFYACGQGGVLLEGSPHGWQQRAEWPSPLHDVAVFRGVVWLAAARDGLLKLNGKSNKLLSVKPNIKALSFDARKNLVITDSNLIAQTTDGLNFVACGQGLLEKLREDEEPLWLLE